MRLKKLSIENFKCFGKPVDIDFGRLTLLTGANSSGKSSIIYAILGAIQSGEFPFQFSTNGKYVNMGDFRYIVHNYKRKEKIRLDFTFEDSLIKEVKTTWEEDDKNNLSRLFELHAVAEYFSLSITKNNENKYSVNYYFDPNILPENDYHSMQLEKSVFSDTIPEKVEGLEFMGFPFKYYENNQLTFHSHLIFEHLQEVFYGFENILNFIGPFRLSIERSYYEQSKTNWKVGATGDGYLDQIIYWETNKDQKLKELVAQLKKLKLLYSFKTIRRGGGKYEISVKVKKNGHETPLSDVGSGVSQFLPIMVADLQLPDDSTLFIAEPETHLHPSIQSSFGDYIVNQISTTEKNYVIETHSEYLLNKIRLAIVKGEIKEEDVKVLFLDNEGEDNVVHKIEFKPNGQIIGAPKNFFKTYMMDVMEISLNAVK